jgi:hypothetical protein
VQVNTWKGEANDWVLQWAHPSLMINSTSNKKVYGSIAVTSIGYAFAVMKRDGQPDEIENWAVADGAIQWSLVGSISPW